MKSRDTPINLKGMEVFIDVAGDTIAEGFGWPFILYLKFTIINI
jgi:hypothetical protein